MSLQFDPRPVRRAGGPDPAVLLVVALAAFVALALVKPWEATAPREAAEIAPSSAPSLPRAGVPTPFGSTQPVATPGARTAEFSALIRTRATDLVEELPGRSGLGIRVITERRAAPLAFAGPHALLFDGRLLERWYPADTTSALAGADAASISIEGFGDQLPVLALGLTAPLGETVLDVRFWRASAMGPRRVAVADLGASRVPGERLFVPGDGHAVGWSAGWYVAEVLLGTRIARLPFALLVGPDPPSARLPRAAFTPSVEQIQAAIAGRHRGAFVLDARGAAAVAAVRGVNRLDARRAWLALGDAAPRGSGDGAPTIARFAEVAPAVLGVTLPRGAVVQAASLWSVAPEQRPLHAVRHVGIGSTNGAVSADLGPMGERFYRSRRFVAFSRLDGRTWPAGVYRITVRYWDPSYRLQEWSYHFDVGVDPDAPVPELLRAAATVRARPPVDPRVPGSRATMLRA